MAVDVAAKPADPWDRIRKVETLNQRLIETVGGQPSLDREDELPQLCNVLGGEMSWIGPRPERPVFCEMLGEQIPLYSQRHSVRPGITGWAQVRYQYGSSVDDAKTKLEYDLFYIKHMSIVLDIVILFETAKVMLYGWGSK